ncbi:MAG: carboxypeptidase regulatory-like domain-containing protein [Gemmatimonadaceae bacterium]|nr:carboxypeptidase regulatory-like domain-containing protein [Gemmatimonadaceae bacterium]
MIARAALVGSALLTLLGREAPARWQAPRITGVVYDSIAGTVLRGASVQLLPLEPSRQAEGRRTTESDSAGRYTLVDVPAGRYLIGFFHAKLDSLGIDLPVRRIDVRLAAEQVVDLATPSAGTVIAGWCGAAGARPDAGAILGFVRDVASAELLAGATVAAQWSAISIGPGGARAGVQEAAAPTSGTGWFRLCGVPRGGILLLHAVSDVDSSALLELDVPAHGLLLRDIMIHRRASSADAPSTIVSGIVRDRSGQGLPGVRVRLYGHDAETRTSATGEFRLGATAAGTQLLDARLIGFVPARRVVDVSPVTGARVDLTMADFPTEIDTVRVMTAFARRTDLLAGFERRRRLGHGTFLDPDQVEQRRPLVFTDLVRGLPGVQVRSVDQMTRQVEMRGASGEVCVPALVVDGVRVPVLDMSVDDVIPADLVKAVEVYPRRIQAPPEYQTPECGSVVVWTGVRGWLARGLRAAGRRP